MTQAPPVRTADFEYDLPPDRIAQRPVARGSSRLMVMKYLNGTNTEIP